MQNYSNWHVFSVSRTTAGKPFLFLLHFYVCIRSSVAVITVVSKQLFHHIIWVSFSCFTESFGIHKTKLIYRILLIFLWDTRWVNKLWVSYIVWLNNSFSDNTELIAFRLICFTDWTVFPELEAYVGNRHQWKLSLICNFINVIYFSPWQDVNLDI